MSFYCRFTGKSVTNDVYKGIGRSVPVQTVNKYGGVGRKFHSFLTSVLKKVNDQLYQPWPLYLQEKRARYSLIRTG
jgi:hypothetical protein